MALGLSYDPNAFAWGQKGHDVVSRIAENHLKPEVRDSVEKLLENHSLVYYANWLDNASHTPEYSYSSTWHYKNIDAGETYESAPMNPDGDIIRAIRSQVGVIKSPASTRQEKNLALKMVIHLMGDLHQPMHMGHLSDRGGNSVMVKFFGKPVNLHSLWDDHLPEAAHKWSHTEWQQQLDRLSPDEIAEIIGTADIDDWGKESYAEASRIYDATPEGTEVSYDYIAQWTPSVESRLLKGGLRLGYLLNSIFNGSNSKGNDPE